jgi:hypothetical protein
MRGAVCLMYWAVLGMYCLALHVQYTYCRVHLDTFTSTYSTMACK